MANNRMWLVHAETGKRVLLAKSFGSVWYPWIPPSEPSGLPGALAEAFAAVGTCDTGWHLEFEHRVRTSPEVRAVAAPPDYK